jgi:hypothetical protein
LQISKAFLYHIHQDKVNGEKKERIHFAAVMKYSDYAIAGTLVQAANQINPSLDSEKI